MNFKSLNDSLPSDPAMLVSWVNMMLRDNYSSLDELCDDREIDRNELERKLGAAGFIYDAANRRFY